MDAKLRSIKNNPMLGRARAEVEIKHEGEPTPSKEDVKSRLAAEEDFEADKLEVVHIYTGYGNQTSEAEIVIAELVDEEEYEEEFEEHTPETQVTAEESEPEEETDAEEAESDENSDIDYDDIVSGTIGDAKDALNELDNPDYEAALEAEKNNKNRTTFIDWLESQ